MEAVQALLELPVVQPLAFHIMVVVVAQEVIVVLLRMQVALVLAVVVVAALQILVLHKVEYQFMGEMVEMVLLKQEPQPQAPFPVAAEVLLVQLQAVLVLLD
jgi:hypothetical protein